ncbi:MAG: alkyl hydroperoxide reductase [Planctomycetota bacterium]
MPGRPEARILEAAAHEARGMDERGPRWAGPLLRTAALYNLLFGGFAVLFPSAWFEWSGMPVPSLLSLWQCIGMVVGVYGVGYWCAARAPLRHWPIVLVGLLGKVFGPIGFVGAAARGELPWSAGWLLLANDLVWWVPFALLLLAARRHHHRPSARH